MAQNTRGKTIELVIRHARKGEEINLRLTFSLGPVNAAITFPARKPPVNAASLAKIRRVDFPGKLLGEDN